MQEVVHMRARGAHPYFKLVLITNGTWLDFRPVQEGLQYFTRDDEIWIKLDAGTQLYMNRVNRSEVPLDKGAGQHPGSLGGSDRSSFRVCFRSSASRSRLWRRLTNISGVFANSRRPGR